MASLFSRFFAENIHLPTPNPNRFAYSSKNCGAKNKPRSNAPKPHTRYPFFRNATAKNHLNPIPVEAKPHPASHPTSPPPKVQAAKGALAPDVEIPVDISSPAVAKQTALFSSQGRNRYNEWRSMEKSKSPAGDQAIERLVAEIKTRRYSRKPLKHMRIGPANFNAI